MNIRTQSRLSALLYLSTLLLMPWGVYFLIWMFHAEILKQFANEPIIWHRADMTHYLDITVRNYSYDASRGSNVAFFPIYPRTNSNTLFTVEQLEIWQQSLRCLLINRGMVNTFSIGVFMESIPNNRALSIRQPHAEAIMTGKKKIEYRSFPTHIRGRVYIYACIKHDDEGKDLARGVVIGSVEITDCTGDEGDYRWHLAKPERLAKPRKPTGQPQPSFFFAW